MGTEKKWHKSTHATDNTKQLKAQGDSCFPAPGQGHILTQLPSFNSSSLLGPEQTTCLNKTGFTTTMFFGKPSALLDSLVSRAQKHSSASPLPESIQEYDSEPPNLFEEDIEVGQGWSRRTWYTNS